MTPKQIHDVLVNEVLETVETPAQYLGGEINIRKKPDSEVDFRLALCFPDVYSVGMSHLGLQILYKAANDMDRVAAERVFTPWPDMADRMRERNIPLFSLETFRPVRTFDLVGFSLQYEMLYTNVLEMLDLAGIPFRAADRSDSDPIIVGGGPCAFEPEPMAEFFDLFIIGDGEEALPQLINLLRECRGLDRRKRLLRCALEVEGAYVPAFYDVSYNEDGTIEAIQPNEPGVPEHITPAFVRDLDSAPFPDAPVVPYVKTVHDRISLEIMRGCVRGCRFCHAGMIRRPARIRSIETLLDTARASLKNTGYDAISLSSLSSSDYPQINELLQRFCDEFKPQHVNISLSSLRITDQLALIPVFAGQVRKSGLTLAVEAGTERLRRVINKNIKDEDLFAGVSEAYRQGWSLIKLYFMIGLPTETDDDVDSMTRLAKQIAGLRRSIAGSPARLNVSVATFIPKPHTPFQWEPMIDLDRIKAIRNRVMSAPGGRSIRWRFHSAERSILEGVLSRGDRRLARTVENAWRAGCVFDAWEDHFSFERWMNALDATGLDPGFYAHRMRQTDEVTPWNHIVAGVTTRFLLEERESAEKGEWSKSCLEGPCTGCGACQAHGVEPKNT